MIRKNETLQHYYEAVPDSLVKKLFDFRQTVPLQSVEIGKHQWTYYTSGDAENTALLLLHGGGGDAEAMFKYIQAFSEHFHVIAPNIPSSIRSIDNATVGLRALLAHEQIQAAHIVGFSFGAMLAQIYIRRFQDTVLDMVITHTTIPSAHLAERMAMQKTMMTLYPAPLLIWLMKRAYRNHIAQSITPCSEDEKLFWQAYFEELYTERFTKKHLHSRSAIATDYHSNYEFNARDLLEWDGDLLIIESDCDNAIDEGDRGSLKGMYNRAYVQTLEGYDHLAPLLASQEMSRSIINFLVDREM